MEAIELRSRESARWKRVLTNYSTLFVLAVLIILFEALRPKYFLSLKNVLNIIQQVALFGLAALGLTFPLAMKNFDLSVGYTASLAGIVVVKLFMAGFSEPVAIICTLLLVGLLCGALNGTITAFLRVPSLVATIGSGFLFFGVTILITGGTRLTYGIPAHFNVYGILPVSLVLLFGVAAISFIILHRTGLGRLIYAIGNNEITCVNAGVRVGGIKLIAFIFSSIFAALSGIMLSSQVMMGDPIGANRYLMQGLAAAYLGTGIFRRGEANILGTVIGILIIGVAYNGMTIINVNYSLREAITGVILIAGLLFARNSR
jgi:ribose transport system permease protein